MKEEDYKYYFYIIFSVLVSFSFGVLVLESYLYFYFDTHINNIYFYRYFYKDILLPLDYKTFTFWVVAVDLLLMFVLLGCFLRKNKFSLYQEYSFWAKMKNVKKMNIFHNKGFAIGRYKGKYLRMQEPLAVTVMAPAGTGKTAGVLVPSVLSLDDDCIIVNDPKGEVRDFTYRYREQLGDVYVFEWGKEKNERCFRDSTWNPISLANLSKKTDLRARQINLIVQSLIPDGKDEFWTNSAKKIMNAMIMYEVYGNELDGKDTTIGDVKDKIARLSNLAKDTEHEGKGTAGGFATIADALRESGDNLDVPSFVKQMLEVDFSEIKDVNETTLGSMLSTLSTSLSIYNNESIRNITSTTVNDFSMTNVKGKKGRPVTIYLISPATEQELFGLMSRIFADGAYRYLGSIDDLKAVKEGNMVRMLLDEFAFMAKSEALIGSPAITRGYRTSIMLICQDKNQVEKIYSDKEVDILTTNTACTVVLRQNEPKTAEYYAKRAGETQYFEYQGRGQNRQKVKKLKPLIKATDLTNLPKGKQVVFMEGFSKSPIYADTPFYFKDKQMVEKIKKHDVLWAEERTQTIKGFLLLLANIKEELGEYKELGKKFLYKNIEFTYNEKLNSIFIDKYLIRRNVPSLEKVEEQIKYIASIKVARQYIREIKEEFNKFEYLTKINFEKFMKQQKELDTLKQVNRVLEDVEDKTVVKKEELGQVDDIDSIEVDSSDVDYTDIDFDDEE